MDSDPSNLVFLRKRQQAEEWMDEALTEARSAQKSAKDARWIVYFEGKRNRPASVKWCIDRCQTRWNKVNLIKLVWRAFLKFDDLYGPGPEPEAEAQAPPHKLIEKSTHDILTRLASGQLDCSEFKRLGEKKFSENHWRALWLSEGLGGKPLTNEEVAEHLDMEAATVHTYRSVAKKAIKRFTAWETDLCEIVAECLKSSLKADEAGLEKTRGTVLVMHHGVSGRPCQSVAEIADRLRLDVENVRSLLCEAQHRVTQLLDGNA